MQAIICASKHRFNVLGQYRQTQLTIHGNNNGNNNSSNGNNNSNNNSNNNGNNNSNSNHKGYTNSASDICTGPFYSII